MQKQNNSFAIYLEQFDEEGNSSYRESEENIFPKNGYVFNNDLSGCIDTYGNDVKDVLSYEDNIGVSVNTNKTLYCYVYFDEKENLSNICNGSTMQECMSKKEQLKTIENLSDETKGEMFRYQGQAVDVDNNYICFETKDNCNASDETRDKYMYRIIGIEESGRIKVIKKEALNEYSTWNDDRTVDIKWPQSNVFNAITGAKFLTNANYVPSGWEGKIVDENWLYGDVLISDKNYNGQEMFEIESGHKEAEWIPGKDEERVSKTWTDTIPSKVSLMYISDFLMAISDEAICNIAGIYDENCKTGWIHISNNDPNPPRAGTEYVMDRAGYDVSYKMFNSINIGTEGKIGRPGLDHASSLRPTFYIINSISLSGLGTIDNPYIIE